MHNIRQAEYQLRQGTIFLTAAKKKSRYLGEDQQSRNLIETYAVHNTKLKEGIGITHSYIPKMTGPDGEIQTMRG